MCESYRPGCSTYPTFWLQHLQTTNKKNKIKEGKKSNELADFFFCRSFVSLCLFVDMEVGEVRMALYGVERERL